MKLTKYLHACLVLEEQDSSLVIDPGNFSTDFVIPSNVVAVVITHSHGDHYDEATLHAIQSANPQAQLFGPQEIADTSELEFTPVAPGQKIGAGPFELEFTGGEHATIHPDIRPVGNIGVIINTDLLYYPGDSFTQPPRHMKWIATPVAAPWLKISDAVDFLRTAAPDHAFATHDAILSDSGQALVDRVISGLIDSSIVYYRMRLSEKTPLSDN